MKRTAIRLGALFLFCGPALAQDQGFERFPTVTPEFPISARLDPWYPRLCGDFKFDEGAVEGDRLNIHNALGGAARFVAPALELAWSEDENRFSLRASRAFFDTDETLVAPHQFNETLFPTGAEVDAEIRVTELVLGYDRRLTEGRDYFLSAGGLGRYFLTEIELSSPATGTDEDNLNALLPELLFRGGWRLYEELFLEAELAGTVFRFDDLKARSYTAAGGLRLRVSEQASLLAGWRGEKREITDSGGSEENDINFLLDGPFLSFEIRF